MLSSVGAVPEGEGGRAAMRGAAVGPAQQGGVLELYPAGIMIQYCQHWTGWRKALATCALMGWVRAGLGFGPEAVRDCGTGSGGDVWLDKLTHLISELQISLTKTKLELLNGLNQCLLLYFFFDTKCSVC